MIGGLVSLLHASAVSADRTIVDRPASLWVVFMAVAPPRGKNMLKTRKLRAAWFSAVCAVPLAQFLRRLACNPLAHADATLWHTPCFTSDQCTLHHPIKQHLDRTSPLSAAC
jgi:hypothetical protein